MRVRSIVAGTALALVLAPGAGATSGHVFSCGGFSPSQTRCAGTITMRGDRVRVEVSSPAVFAGVIEVFLRSGDATAYLGPCPHVTAALSCMGTRTGVFEPGDVVEVEVRVPDYDLAPVGVGDWRATVTG